MLFNAYTGGRPAEFVHASKGKASQDPLRKADETSKVVCLLSVPGKDYDNESNAGDSPKDDRDRLFDNDNQDACDSNDPSSDHINMDDSADSGYHTEETDNPISKDNCPVTNANVSKLQIEQNCDATEYDEFREARRKYKALCYKDIRI